MSTTESFFDQLLATSFWEWLAVFLGILYVIFAARKQIICWYFAFASSALYVFICVEYQLYIESGLQLFYVAMAMVGWYSWRNTKRVSSNVDLLDEIDIDQENDIKIWSLSKHAVNIIASGAIAASLGYFFSVYTNQANPFMDAFTTVFSLAATFMVTQKVLENWIYWVIIDLVSIYLYSSRGLQLSAVLYGIFTVLAIVGFVSWYKHFKRQRA